MALNQEQKSYIKGKIFNYCFGTHETNGIEMEFEELSQRIFLDSLKGLNIGVLEELSRETTFYYHECKYNNDDNSLEAVERRNDLLCNVHNSLLIAVDDGMEVFKPTFSTLDEFNTKYKDKIFGDKLSHFATQEAILIKNNIEKTITNLEKDPNEYVRESVSPEVIEVCENLFALNSDNLTKQNADDITENITNKRKDMLYGPNGLGNKKSDDLFFLTELIKKVTDLMYDKDYLEPPKPTNKIVR